MSLRRAQKIYLAGGVNGFTVSEATEWRNYAALQLNLRGFEVINPLRSRVGRDGRFVGGVYSPAEVVVRDKQDILRADGLLVEYTRSDRNYAGTSMEILFAFEHHKLIVVWSSHAGESYWLKYHATVILPTLDDCIEFIASYWG